MPNFKNLGIAKALNQGCKKALELNYDWALTMDQDSRWDDREDLLHYLDRTEKLFLYEDKNISFSPYMISLTSPPIEQISIKINNRAAEPHGMLFS
jgi:glycosyltransferase involved in cell wall biosynthesis